MIPPLGGIFIFFQYFFNIFSNIFLNNIYIFNIFSNVFEMFQYISNMGSLGGAAVWRLPLAQGAILETRDRIPRRAPSAWSLLLPLPVSLPLSHLSLCDYHK